MKFAPGLVAIAAKHAIRDAGTPIVKVIELLDGLKERIGKDAKKESAMYEKVETWCKTTLERKKNDIDTAIQNIEDLSTSILKAEADVAVYEAEVKQLKKNIAENERSQKEANDTREKEKNAYIAFKTEGEQSLGALNTAIKILTGAGARKKGTFLALHEAELVSVAAGLRKVLGSEAAVSLSKDDIQVVNEFVNQPAIYLHGNAESALQTSNPFGDYAPKSGRIQGILKGLSDAFVDNLKKAKEDEATAVKNWKELSATKKAELTSLTENLDATESLLADTGLRLANMHEERDSTEAQLKADKKFFAESKLSCQDKARQWTQRSKIRAEEVESIKQAIKVLKDAAEVKGAAVSFLQTITHKAQMHGSSREKAVRNMMKKHPELAELAVEAQMTGHFDKVIWAIDKMIASIREEEADDVSHRDRCQNDVKDNGNDAEDLHNKIKTTQDKLEGLQNKAKGLRTKLDEQANAIKSTKADLAEALSMRNSENKEFQEALMENRKAVELLGVAIHELEKFYIQNGISMKLLQNPADTKMPDAPGPGEYGGRKTDTAPIMGMIAMIKEDLEKEIKTSTAEDAEAQSDFERERAAMDSTLEQQIASKASSEKDLAVTESDIADTKGFLSDRNADLEANGEEAKALENDCDWVKTHFATRRDKRKAELDGLVEAKNFLAGGGE